MVLLYSHRTSQLALIWWHPTRRRHPIFRGRWGEASIGACFPIIVKVAAEKVPPPCGDVACQECKAPRAMFIPVTYSLVSPITSKDIVVLTDKTYNTIL